MFSSQCKSCYQHHSSQSNNTTSSKVPPMSSSARYRPFPITRAARNILVIATLLLATLVLEASSSSIAGTSSSASSGTAVDDSLRESAPTQKEFPASRVREMLKEMFRKRRAEMLEGMLQEAGAGRARRVRMMSMLSGGSRGRGRATGGGGGGGGGGGESGGDGGEGGGKRERREVGVVEESEEKRLLSFHQEDRLGTFIGEVMTCQNIPGLSLGMARGGARQGQGYGVADMETGRPVDKDTVFGIGSNTKAFAAASLAHVMASAPLDKRFSFSTPLAEILGEGFELMDDTRTAQTTLMDVLSHRTGLASADLGIFAGYPSNITSRNFCRQLKYLPEMVPFRSAWYYSNAMFALVSHVCEEASGNKSWAQVLEEGVWGPLGMNTTSLAPGGLSLDNVALPYIMRKRVYDMFVQQDPRLFDLHPLQAAGSVMTSAMDMTKWMTHLLSVLKRPVGVYGSLLRQVFTERTLLPSYMRLRKEEFKEPIVHIGYGMGFMTSYYKGHLVYWHHGDLHGYQSIVLLVPDLETGVYVAVNGPSSQAHTERTVTHLAYFVLELLQGNRPWVRLPQVCPGMEDREDPDYDEEEGGEEGDEEEDGDEYYDYDYDYAGDDTLELNVQEQDLLRPLEDYLGVFKHGLLGELRVVREEERNSLLRLELGRLLVADLIPTKDANLFKLAPRLPVSNTKEWIEVEHLIGFKSSSAGFPHSGPGPSPGSAPAYVNTPESREQAGSASNNGSAIDADSSSKNATAKEEVALLALDQVQIKWMLETYVFHRVLPEDPVAPAEADAGDGAPQQEGGKGKDKADPNYYEPAPEISKQQSTVNEDSSSSGAVGLLPVAVDGPLKSACLLVAYLAGLFVVVAHF